LRRDFHRERVEALRKNPNVLQKLVVEDDGRNRDEQAGSRGQERFGNTGRDRAKACRVGVAETGKGVDDAPNRAKEADERRHRTGRCKPRHSFFGAADFFRRRDLHVGSDGLQAFQFWRLVGAGSVADLALKFPISGSVDRSKWRARRGESLRISDAASGAEDAQKIIAFATDATEEPELLKNHAPGDDRKQKKNRDDNARNPTGILQNASEVDENDCREQKDDVSPQCEENFTTSRTVAHAFM